MAKEKKGWDDIPSLQGLEVDWKYEAENPFGKRAYQRIAENDLIEILGVKKIPIKVVAKDFEEIGALLDLAQGGCSVLLKTKLAEGQVLMVGFILGNQKVISKAKIIHVESVESKYRIGVEFVDLDKDLRSYIGGVISSKVYQQPL